MPVWKISKAVLEKPGLPTVADTDKRQTWNTQRSKVSGHHEMFSLIDTEISATGRIVERYILPNQLTTDAKVAGIFEMGYQTKYKIKNSCTGYYSHYAFDESGNNVASLLGLAVLFTAHIVDLKVFSFH